MVDSVADGRQRAAEGVLLVGDGTLALVDLEGDVHTALQVETVLERPEALGGFDERAVGRLFAHSSVAREECENREPDGGGNQQEAGPQTVHALQWMKGRRSMYGLAMQGSRFSQSWSTQSGLLSRRRRAAPSVQAGR